MPLDHEGARRLMAEAVGGQLGSDDERELALHLVGCNECKIVYEGLQHTNPALGAIELGSASIEALDAAVFRATTVLRGEADPGPMGLSEEAPRIGDIPDANTVRIDSHYEPEPTFTPGAPHLATGPMHPPPPPSSSWDVPEVHVRAIEPDVVPDVVPDVIPDVIEEPIRPDGAPPKVSIELEELPPVEPQVGEPLVAPRSEIESLLDEDRGRYETLQTPIEDDGADMGGPGPWLLAIAVAVVLAVVAGLLVFRGQGLFGGGGGDLPTAAEVRRSVERSFTDMKSLKTSFEINKVNLYRVGREAGSLNYSFSNGIFTGRIAYDRALGYKQDLALEVGGVEVERAEIVQTAEETRSLVGSGADRRLLIERNPPLGPPDGSLRPSLGTLEDALGTAATLLAGADDLKVVGSTERDGRKLYTVVANIRATELSRADRIEAALDATTSFPVIVKRSISRPNARVLGPSSALTDEDIDRAFADNERVTTEVVELGSLQYDEIVLPNDLVLDVPGGVDEQSRDSKYERLARPELTALDFSPLLPRTLPSGFEEKLFAVYRGQPQNWGPGKTLSKPESVFHSEYFDGKTTITVTQRKLKAKFALKGSPLARAGLPITVKRLTQADKEFFFGTSPELPPHAYGFLGNTFVMAVGYASQAQLIGVLASLAEEPSAISDLSPSPSGSPSGSAGSSPGTTSPSPAP